ncbi:hypothetical protein A2630_00195 [Candidatus Woesebacteria bacterium RIFCSPHIGHO2_01_FULL_44_10]|uniref:DNA polymerase III delta N-terminal domain-containing protein n=1 Tax=Candidatus Woesebacteria bacterium RIFCSPLOWO2_01_FULL_44_14 TaxID=1802525 RepID=A0A1F8BXA4_9BACT|nr:MAG: hypothetical protein A2630_00195 [Candidatus Woesebacteria bacterium RIFCSPHIGHO2_01_FULL_44_10]OGM56287.1 MAG: hypothetical protein A3F62_03515 [Candidatus Woesebacteria bacterium RIFCSPHIGHO2_12_FULL_44_11]OGM68723.1 MAG: hypothetical protein A2975_05495 [Candidatus Woesebacteria bacterium RIFCSPLOWO2_01_FULL_44_14]
MSKITVLYGDHVTVSRQRMLEIVSAARKKGWEILREITTTDSLFATERLFVIEDASQLTEKDFDQDINVLIWQKNQIPASLKKILPKDTKYEEFKLPVVIWKFLDTFSLRLFHEVCQKEAVEFVFALMARQVRDLYWVSSDPKTFAGPAWRKSRLVSQAAKYGELKLKNVIQKLAQIDVAAKTGEADLTTSLDLLIVKELE